MMTSILFVLLAAFLVMWAISLVVISFNEESTPVIVTAQRIIAFTLVAFGLFVLHNLS